MIKRMLLILILSAPLLADEDILFDYNFSPYALSPDLITAHKLIDLAYHETIEPPSLKKPLPILGRVAIYIAGYMPLNEFMDALVHEVFGHGYRIRDLGNSRATVTGYTFEPPLPYGPGGAATYCRLAPSLTVPQMQSIVVAGLEAESVLAHTLKMRFFSENEIDPLIASMYFWAQQSLTFYSMTLNHTPFGSLTGHDIDDWITLMGQIYPSSVSVHRYQESTLLNFLDLTSLNCFYSVLNYLVTGNNTPLWAIPIKGAKYLPNAQVMITPFGPMYYLENTLLYKDRVYYFYGKAGHYWKNTYGGFGVEVPTIYKDRYFSLGFRFDGFYQPKVLDYSQGTNAIELGEWSYFNYDRFVNHTGTLGYSDQELTKKIVGLSFWMNLKVPLFRDFLTKKESFSFIGQFGYKTTGYLPGESLFNRAIVRLGFSVPIGTSYLEIEKDQA